MQSIQVMSASFFHLECSHEQLFHVEYKRSNRTKGLKILRCFPHCCPEHIDRSYCGTSLSVRVNLARPSEEDGPPADVSAVRLFARFESVSDMSLRPGECVKVDKIDAATQSEANPDGLWVGGILDKPPRLVAAISTDSSDEDKSLVFHLNSRSYAKWYYDWESGANKAQRLMKHVLRAYVVELCGVDKDDNFISFDSKDTVKQLYRVLHVESSPEFTVISYRRAPMDQYQGMCMGSGVSLYEETPRHGESPVDSYDDGAYSQSRTDWRSLMEARPAPLYSKAYQAKRQHSSPPPPRRMEAERIPDLLEDKLRWEYKNMSVVSVSRNLALVYSFVRWAPLSVYASFVDELVHGVNDSLLESLEGSSLETSRLNCFSKLLLNQARAGAGTGPFVRGKQAGSRAPAVLPRGLETLLRVLAESTLWLFSVETRQWMHGFFLKYASTVEDKYALRQCFVLFIQQLQTRLEAQVFAQTPLGNLANAAEEVIATVYSYEYFHARRPQVRKTLSGQSFAGWNAFVAQMRETYISKRSSSDAPLKLAKRQSALNFVSAHRPQNPVECEWNAEWLLDVDEAVWEPNENADLLDSHGFRSIDDDDGSVSLYSLLELISQLARIEVGINMLERILYIRSTQSVAGPLDCMRLVLDGKDRVFSQFPNGFATGLDAGTCGDYIGEMKVEEPGRLVVYLELFQWCVRGDGPSYHVRMNIECWHDGQLCISGDILSSSACFTPEEALYVGEMTLRDKREAMNSCFAQLQRPVSAGPWKEFGRFRLNYINV